MLGAMPGRSVAVTLREVTGEPEEPRALQRVMESDEDFALRVTGHPPGPADAQSTLMFVLEGKSPDDKVVFGVWVDGELVGVLEVGARWPWARRLRLSVVRTNDQVLGFWPRMGFAETGEVRPYRHDKLRSEVLLMDKLLSR
jgi:hypothetical protein